MSLDVSGMLFFIFEICFRIFVVRFFIYLRVRNLIISYARRKEKL